MLPLLPLPLVSFLSFSAQLSGSLLGLWAVWHVPILERDTGKFTNPAPGAQGDRDEGIDFQHFAERIISDFDSKESLLKHTKLYLSLSLRKTLIKVYILYL